MTNPVYNTEAFEKIINGGYTAFEFTDEKYFWSSSVVTVYARVDYKYTKDDDIKYELRTEINRSSGGENGLDAIETTNAYIKLLGEACNFVEAVRNDEEAIMTAFADIQAEQKRLRDEEEAERKAKIDADTRIGHEKAKAIVGAMFANCKLASNYLDTIKVRVRGSDKTYAFFAEWTGSIVAFAERSRYGGYTRIRRSALINKISEMAEIVPIEVAVEEAA